jgi:hypothetical protein
MPTRILVGLAVVVVAVAARVFWPKKADIGAPRFFADQTYNFQTIRALDDVSGIGGDFGETRETISGLKAGDATTAFSMIIRTGGCPSLAQSCR